MATRTSSAIWEGNLKEGKGTMKVGRGAYEGPFSFASRFEDGAGTNPEELIGAAEAGCFSMALSANLSKAGHQPKSVHTIAKVNLEMIGGGPKITSIDLDCEGKTAGHGKANAGSDYQTSPSSRDQGKNIRTSTADRSLQFQDSGWQTGISADHHALLSQSNRPSIGHDR